MLESNQLLEYKLVYRSNEIRLLRGRDVAAALRSGGGDFSRCVSGDRDFHGLVFRVSATREGRGKQQCQQAEFLCPVHDSDFLIGLMFRYIFLPFWTLQNYNKKTLHYQVQWPLQTFFNLHRWLSV